MCETAHHKYASQEGNRRRRRRRHTQLTFCAPHRVLKTIKRQFHLINSVKSNPAKVTNNPKD